MGRGRGREGSFKVRSIYTVLIMFRATLSLGLPPAPFMNCFPPFISHAQTDPNLLNLPSICLPFPLPLSQLYRAILFYPDNAPAQNTSMRGTSQMKDDRKTTTTTPRKKTKKAKNSPPPSPKSHTPSPATNSQSESTAYDPHKPQSPFPPSLPLALQPFDAEAYDLQAQSVPPLPLPPPRPPAQAQRRQAYSNIDSILPGPRIPRAKAEAKANGVGSETRGGLGRGL